MPLKRANPPTTKHINKIRIAIHPNVWKRNKIDEKLAKIRKKEKDLKQTKSIKIIKKRLVEKRKVLIYILINPTD